MWDVCVQCFDVIKTDGHGFAVLIVVDDTAIPCGSVRIQPGGGAGGHNGLADVSRTLGTDAWPRLRIGIDKPGRIPLSNYVLGRFTPEQQELVEPSLDDAAVAAACRHARVNGALLLRLDCRDLEETLGVAGALDLYNGHWYLFNTGAVLWRPSAAHDHTPSLAATLTRTALTGSALDGTALHGTVAVFCPDLPPRRRRPRPDRPPTPHIARARARCTRTYAAHVSLCRTPHIGSRDPASRIPDPAAPAAPALYEPHTERVYEPCMSLI